MASNSSTPRTVSYSPCDSSECPSPNPKRVRLDDNESPEDDWGFHPCYLSAAPLVCTSSSGGLPHRFIYKVVVENHSLVDGTWYQFRPEANIYTLAPPEELPICLGRLGHTDRLLMIRLRECFADHRDFWIRPLTKPATDVSSHHIVQWIEFLMLIQTDEELTEAKRIFSGLNMTFSLSASSDFPQQRALDRTRQQLLDGPFLSSSH
jgi:hypothetical protein